MTTKKAKAKKAKPKKKKKAKRTELYFAFGSNLCERQMRARCPSAKAVEIAWLHGEKMIFRSYSRNWRGGVASIVPANRRTPGIVYAMTANDLARLDRCEGHPYIYKRERVHVQAQHDSNITFECWTYRLPGGELNPPSPIYLAQIYTAYLDWGFDLRRLPRPSRMGRARQVQPYRDHALLRDMAHAEIQASAREAKRTKKAKASGRRRKVAAPTPKPKKKKRPVPDAPQAPRPERYTGWSTTQIAGELRRQTSHLLTF